MSENMSKESQISGERPGNLNKAYVDTGDNGPRTERAKRVAALKQSFFESTPPISGEQTVQSSAEILGKEPFPPESSTAQHDLPSSRKSSTTDVPGERQDFAPDPEQKAKNNKLENTNDVEPANESDAALDVEAPPGGQKGYDEPDMASMMSYFMDKDFRYYFQHPVFRLIIVYLVTFCNFLIYAEDPVAHSEKECYIPVVGNCFAFVCTKYPPNAWALLKVLLWLAAIVSGLLVGKLLIHKHLFNQRFKLKMFIDDQGSWMTMFFTCILFLFIFSWLYNALLLLGGEATEDYAVSHMMGLKNSWFMKAAACGTWCGDFFTAWMVTDIILQEKLYPGFAKPVRTWWNHGWNRIFLFWIVCLSTSIAVVTVIGTDWIQWDTLNRDFVASNEISRSFLASFILVMDLLIVMQDWDFPHFINNFDIKLPGLNTSHIKFQVPNFFKEKWVVHITGKWFNYGIIFVVLILDLNMWKNQMFYEPYDYGQYIDERERVHSVKDEESLESDNATVFTYDWRATNINPETNETYLAGDSVMNSRFEGYALGLKCIAFVPSLAAFICFGVLISVFGRWKPTRDDPHGGRLKSRPRKRRSWFMRQFSGGRKRRPHVELLKMEKKRDGVEEPTMSEAGRPSGISEKEVEKNGTTLDIM